MKRKHPFAIVLKKPENTNASEWHILLFDSLSIKNWTSAIAMKHTINMYCMIRMIIIMRSLLGM